MFGQGCSLDSGVSPAAGAQAPPAYPAEQALTTRCRSELARDSSVGSKLPPTKLATLLMFAVRGEGQPVHHAHQHRGHYERHVEYDVPQDFIVR